MRIEGKVWKSAVDQFWLAEIPMLDLLIQSTSKEEIPEMVKDAIELLVGQPEFFTAVILHEDTIYVDSDNSEKLTHLASQRQRSYNGEQICHR